jgi:thiol-disulfide isomerase/thioredoxin
MFDFYDNFTFLGKLIFLFGVLVVLCSIFYQCTYCKYIPVKLQWDNTAYKSDLAQQVPIEPFEEMPRQSRVDRLQRLRNLKNQNLNSALSNRLQRRPKQSRSNTRRNKLKSLSSGASVSSLSSRSNNYMRPSSSRRSFQSQNKRILNNSKANATAKPKLILFYVDWCKHCKNFKPEWKKLASKIKGLVETVSVNGDTNQEMMNLYNVDKFPTIVYDDGTNAIEYDGQMNADGLKQFVVTNYNNGSSSQNVIY